ncbi:hypothetical protein [uncultured Duncaniella sp.]|uniref:hypothetical protein n=1 Tax=uncultured Duncaniella sp. TaxID=2768039 RepID=UPI0025D4C5A8|nr:hypothetical protein [uncultured Duncaniella sp.]
MKHAFLFSCIICGALSFNSCGGSDSIAERISAAELALANENVDATRELCGEIIGQKDRQTIEAKQMARLSILYMQLNERTDAPEDVEYAVQCFREAFKLNADSAKAFYSSLPVEQDKYAMTLATIVHTLDNPREIPADHDCDPASTDADELHQMDTESGNCTTKE